MQFRIPLKTPYVELYTSFRPGYASGESATFVCSLEVGRSGPVVVYAMYPWPLLGLAVHLEDVLSR
jgi:hypothetical protein